MSIRIITGYPTKDNIGVEYRKSPTDLAKKMLPYYSPLTQEVKDVVFSSLDIDRKCLMKDEVCDILESEYANAVASLMDNELMNVRLKNPVECLPQKCQRNFADLLWAQHKKGKNITILTQSQIVCDVIRLFVKRQGGKNADGAVEIVYFDNDGNRHLIGIDENGGYRNKAQGMFDEQAYLIFMLNGE